MCSIVVAFSSQLFADIIGADEECAADGLPGIELAATTIAGLEDELRKVSADREHWRAVASEVCMLNMLNVFNYETRPALALLPQKPNRVTNAFAIKSANNAFVSIVLSKKRHFFFCEVLCFMRFHEFL